MSALKCSFATAPLKIVLTVYAIYGLVVITVSKS